MYTHQTPTHAPPPPPTTTVAVLCMGVDDFYVYTAYIYKLYSARLANKAVSSCVNYMRKEDLDCMT